MNKIWFLMMFLSFCILCWSAPSSILPSMLQASSKAFSLSLELCSVYIVWLGILEIVDASGLGDKLAKLLKPIIKKLFKTQNSDAQKYIALNMSSNILGLGNASTPLGIKAIQKLNEEKDKSKSLPSVLMLIIINATSIQLLPSTVIGLRTACGSSNATDIIIPTILSTIVTFVIGILLAKLCEKIVFKKHNKNKK